MYPTNHPHFRQVKELAAFQLNRQISDEKFDLCINIEHGIAFAYRSLCQMQDFVV